MNSDQIARNIQLAGIQQAGRQAVRVQLAAACHVVLVEDALRSLREGEPPRRPLDAAQLGQNAVLLADGLLAALGL